MRPSISVSLDPGLERGLPWGRDLYTFVTSAAGHMMRTLQKPRKNRPSKRQVNHRRFLHNMIQRKFADIEAANHRLASAIYLKDEEKNTASLSSRQQGMNEQPGNTTQRERPHEVCADSDEMPPSTESHESKRRHRREIHSFMCNSQMNNQSENSQKGETDRKPAESEFTQGSEDHRGSEIFLLECLGEHSTSKQMVDLPDDTQPPLKDSGFKQFDQNADFGLCVSPELSPVAQDSYDFSVQAQTGKSSGPQAQRSLTDFSEGQLTDIVDFFCAGSEDFGSFPDLETYFDRMCECQGAAGQEKEADDVTFVEQWDNFGEDLLCEENEPTCRYRHDCSEAQVPSPNQSRQQNPRWSVYDPQEQFYNSGNLHHASVSYHCGTQVDTYTDSQKSACMLMTRNNSDLTPFEGIAQSFSVSPHSPENRPIPTPPHEDDWLFTDILKDRQSSDFP